MLIHLMANPDVVPDHLDAEQQQQLDMLAYRERKLAVARGAVGVHQAATTEPPPLRTSSSSPFYRNAVTMTSALAALNGNFRSAASSSGSRRNDEEDDNDVSGAELDSDRLPNHLLDEICNDMGIHDSMDLDIYDFATCEDQSSTELLPPADDALALTTTFERQQQLHHSGPAVPPLSEHHSAGAQDAESDLERCRGTVETKCKELCSAATTQRVIDRDSNVHSSGASDPQCDTRSTSAAPVAGHVSLIRGDEHSLATVSGECLPAAEVSGLPVDPGGGLTSSARAELPPSGVASSAELPPSGDASPAVSGSPAATAEVTSVAVSSLNAAASSSAAPHYGSSDSLTAIARLTQRIASNGPNLGTYIDAARSSHSDGFASAAAEASSAAWSVAAGGYVAAIPAALPVSRQYVDRGYGQRRNNHAPAAANAASDLRCSEQLAHELSGAPLASVAAGSVNAAVAVRMQQQQHGLVQHSKTQLRQRSECSPYQVPPRPHSGGSSQAYTPPMTGPLYSSNPSDSGQGSLYNNGPVCRSGPSTLADGSHLPYFNSHYCHGGMARGATDCRADPYMNCGSAAAPGADCHYSLPLPGARSSRSHGPPQSAPGAEYPEDFNMEDLTAPDSTINFSEMPQQPNYYQVPELVGTRGGNVNISFNLSLSGGASCTQCPQVSPRHHQIVPHQHHSQSDSICSEHRSTCLGSSQQSFSPAAAVPALHCGVTIPSLHCGAAAEHCGPQRHYANQPCNSAYQPHDLHSPSENHQQQPVMSAFVPSDDTDRNGYYRPVTNSVQQHLLMSSAAMAQFSPMGNGPSASSRQQVYSTQGFMQRLVSDRSSAFRSHPLFPLLRDLIVADMSFDEPSFPHQLIRDLPSDFGKLLKNYLSRNPPPRGSYQSNHSVESVVMDALKFAHHSLIEKLHQTGSRVCGLQPRHGLAELRGPPAPNVNRSHDLDLLQRQPRHAAMSSSASTLGNAGTNGFCSEFDSTVKRETDRSAGATYVREEQAALRYSAATRNEVCDRVPAAVGSQMLEGGTLQQRSHTSPCEASGNTQRAYRDYPEQRVHSQQRYHGDGCQVPVCTQAAPSSGAALGVPLPGSRFCCLSEQQHGMDMYINNSTEGVQLMKTVLGAEQGHQSAGRACGTSLPANYHCEEGATSSLRSPDCLDTGSRANTSPSATSPLSSPSMSDHGRAQLSFAAHRPGCMPFGSGRQPSLAGVEGGSQPAEGATRKHQSLPKEAVGVMLSWLKEHQDKPYPNDDEKSALIKQTGLTMTQINYWFTNARRRLLPKWRGEDM